MDAVVAWHSDRVLFYLAHELLAGCPWLSGSQWRESPRWDTVKSQIFVLVSTAVPISLLRAIFLSF